MRSLLAVSLFAHLAFAAPSVTLDCNCPLLSLPSFKLMLFFRLYPDGTFTGLTNPSTNVTSYRGVRYADAPIGNLRWRAPITPPSTKLGTVDATKVSLRITVSRCIVTLCSSATRASQQHKQQSHLAHPRTVYSATCVFA